MICLIVMKLFLEVKEQFLNVQITALYRLQHIIFETRIFSKRDFLLKLFVNLKSEVHIFNHDLRSLAVTIAFIFITSLICIRYLFPTTKQMQEGEIEVTSARSRIDTLRSHRSIPSHVESQFTEPLSWDITTNEKEGMERSGAAVTKLRYETWSPPTPWTELSKNLLTNSVNKKPQVSQVTLELLLKLGKIRIGNFEELVDIKYIKINVRNAIGAVLELYINGSKTEYTFTSSLAAAQFQHDLLSMQIAGEPIMNLYHSFELIHRGSMAHDGKEPVLHDSACDDEILLGGVAWDDMYRCLGTSFPNLKRRLQYYADSHITSDTYEENDPLGTLIPQYYTKRKLLGQVDFFRLFCPLLQSSSRPKDKSSPGRLEKLIGLRKQVAQASIYAHDYLRARCVVNNGWKVGSSFDSYSQRIAYDSEVDNIKHDIGAKNEYYEPTISRDIKFHGSLVRPASKCELSNLVGYQTHLLVGSHIFKLPPDTNKDHNVVVNYDPIEKQSSLRDIVESNPDLDFFCMAFFLEGLGIMIIHLYVRALPKGVDSYFDNLLNQYANNPQKLRERMFEVYFQVSPRKKFSSVLQAGIKALSMLLWCYRKGLRQAPMESGGVARRQFYGIKLGYFMEMNHYGGCLKADSALPNNYLALSAQVDPCIMRSIFFRILYCKLESEIFQDSILDCIFVLKGHGENRIKERALGTIRMVCCHFSDRAIPKKFGIQQLKTEDIRFRNQNELAPELEGPTILPNDQHLRSFKEDTLPMKKTALNHSSESKTKQYLHQSSASTSSENLLSSQSNVDPFRAGVDMLIQILKDVYVPTRQSTVLSNEATSTPLDVSRDEIMDLCLSKNLSRDDLRRFYQGSGCDLKIAAVRFVESAEWRITTFPIDTRTCRIELQSGQFFQQGYDFNGNAVFYFRNMCIGPWRGDENAVINAVLHRLESSLKDLSAQKSNIKITLVILLGRPYFKKKKGKENGKCTKKAMSEEDKVKDGGKEDLAAFSTSSDCNPFITGINPRLQSGDKYHTHSNKALLLRLLSIVLQHYPERLYKAILVPGYGHSYGQWRTAVITQMAIRSNLHETRTRSKCFVLNRIMELTDFIPHSQLITIAGGEVPLHPNVFERSNYSS